jgi:predicted transcriptional regulator
MAKIIQTTEQIDYTTGEVKERTIVRSFRGEEPSYIKLYLADISYLYELPTTSGDLMFELLNYVTYGTQEIILNTAAKKRIAEETGMALKTVNNRLSMLVSKGIIARKDPGVYQLNPYLFGKGDWKTIKKLRDTNLHLKIEYDADTNTRSIKGGTN